MAKRNHGDFYVILKYHLFHIFILILFLFAMYKVLVVEAPHQSAPQVAPPCTLESKPVRPKPRKHIRRGRPEGAIPN